MPTQLCAAGMAFLAFSASMFLGLFVGNDFITVVSRSLIALFVFLVLGAIVSIIGQKVVLENFKTEAKMLDEKLKEQNIAEYEKQNGITNDSEDDESVEVQEESVLDDTSQVANV